MATRVLFCSHVGAKDVQCNPGGSGSGRRACCGSLAEHAARMYSVPVYFWSRILVELPSILILPLLAR